MARYNVPQLKGYGDAIQANQSMMNAFKNVGDASTDYLKLEEQKKTNEWNKAFETDKFAETKNQNAISNNNINRNFNYGVDRDGVKDNQFNKEFEYKQNQDLINNNYKDKVFGHTVSQDGIRNNQWSQSFNQSAANQNKPNYSTFNGVDTEGNAVLNMLDKNTGQVVNTGQKVYQAPKQTSPEQAEYYNIRNQDIQDKRVATTEKAFRDSAEFAELNEADQLKAIQYISTHGKAPEVKYDNSWFGKGYYIPGEEQKENKNKQKDGSKVDLSKEY